MMLPIPHHRHISTRSCTPDAVGLPAWPGTSPTPAEALDMPILVSALPQFLESPPGRHHDPAESVPSRTCAATNITGGVQTFAWRKDRGAMRTVKCQRELRPGPLGGNLRWARAYFDQEARRGRARNCHRRNRVQQVSPYGVPRKNRVGVTRPGSGDLNGNGAHGGPALPVSRA